MLRVFQQLMQGFVETAQLIFVNLCSLSTKIHHLRNNGRIPAEVLPGGIKTQELRRNNDKLRDGKVVR